jgi:aryl-alcohol dehydrogenase-like predicted oxidoreductase
MYSWRVSEIILGKAIKKYDMNRDEIVVATKMYNPVGPPGLATRGKNWSDLERTHRLTNQMGLSRKSIMSSVDQSLKAMELDYIDLLLVGRGRRHEPTKPDSLF